MAELVLTDAKVMVNSVDLSDHVRQVKLSYKAEPQDDTAMGMTTRSRTPGLLDWSIVLDFKQDFAAVQVDITLFGLVGAAPFPIEVTPKKTGGPSVTNPRYNGNAILTQYDPISGSIGGLLIAPATFEAAGALARSNT